MVTSGMPRQRLRPASSVTCMVQLFCLACIVAGALSHLSFVGATCSDQRVAKGHVTRFNQRQQELLGRRLTSKMTGVQSAKDLIEVLDGAVGGRVFNGFHASKAYHQLAILKRNSGLQRNDWESAAIVKLHARVQDLALQDQLNVRQLANVVWSIAKLSDRFSIPTELLDALVESLPAKAKSMNAQDLSNSLWAFAQLKDVAPHVLQAVPALVNQIPDIAKEMDPQGLSNCLRAALQLEADAPKVLDIVPIIVMEAQSKVKDMSAQGLSNILEAIVPLQQLVPEVAQLVADGDSQEDMIRSAAARLKILLPRLKGKDLIFTVPVVVWATAKFGMHDSQFLRSVAERFLKSCVEIMALPDFGVCALSWSYQELDTQADHTNFRELLASEVARRRFSQADVESCRLGRSHWRGAKRR